jgi:hypothetical protein
MPTSDLIVTVANLWAVVALVEGPSSIVIGTGLDQSRTFINLPYIFPLIRQHLTAAEVKGEGRFGRKDVHAEFLGSDKPKFNGFFTFGGAGHSINRRCRRGIEKKQETWR